MIWKCNNRTVRLSKLPLFYEVTLALLMGIYSTIITAENRIDTHASRQTTQTILTTSDRHGSNLKCHSDFVNYIHLYLQTIVSTSFYLYYHGC